MDNCWISCDSGVFDPKVTSVVQALMVKPKAKIKATDPEFVIGVVNATMAGFVEQKRITTDKPGYAVETVQLICEQLGYRCKFVLSNSSDFGSHRNGSWTGMLGDVERQIYNTSLPAYLKTSERLQNFFFTETATGYIQYLVTRKPVLDEVVSLQAFVNPLNWKIWLTIFLTLVALTVVIRFLQTFRYPQGQQLTRKVPKTVAIGETIESGLLIFINISVYLVRKGPAIKRLARPTKLLLMTWGLGALVIMASYTGGLLSAMFKTQVRLPFSDLTTLFSCIEKEMCKLVVSPEDEWILAHMVDPLSRYNPLVVILSRNPPIKTGSFGESLRLIQATSNFYLVTPPNDKNFIEEILKKKCALTLVKDEVDYYFPFAEANSYKVFEKQLKQLRQSGILKKLISRYPLKDECGQSQKKTTAPPVPLRLGLGAIVIWCFGLLMAGAILLGEYLASRF